jgi:hypothetical protein
VARASQSTRRSGATSASGPLRRSWRPCPLTCTRAPPRRGAAISASARRRHR